MSVEIVGSGILHRQREHSSVWPCNPGILKYVFWGMLEGKNYHLSKLVKSTVVSEPTRVDNTFCQDNSDAAETIASIPV